ncbi:glycogen debranching protein GlgX [Dactylosporangium sp. NPDC049525]|uniref:glycogen debranching protein GlgX n=1 Tax=Dactylosporangium sp. NPDC049525 TaxID=3154730 RepID=UPI00343CE96B
MEYDLPAAWDAGTQQVAGSPAPLGATYDGVGVNFAVYAGTADRVTLCLFDDDGAEEQVELRAAHKGVWHGYVTGAAPGQRYGYRVDGAYEPAQGLRHNPYKLLLDPYAKAIDGDVTWDPAVYGHDLDDPDRMSTSDSAPFVPKSVVVSPFFDWGSDAPPRVPYTSTVIYEAHVRGLTMLHPDVPQELRGTYAGVAHPAVVEHLRSLGVTTLELLPVHHFVHEQHLVEQGLSNYWGYNTIGYFAPYHGYAAGARGQQVQEFRSMVKALHAAGIEVILDVVYTHTAEGDHTGPMLSFRGLDNGHYYKLDDDGRHTGATGAGNSLNVRNPHSLQLVMDSLRYWVTQMHVDGFRFDLAPSLARDFTEFERVATFLQAVHQDPVLGDVKLIAQPRDAGPDGDQSGNFPPLWTEWNDRFRDTVRDFWRGEPGMLSDFVTRFSGSADLFQDDGRRPFAGVNYVTSHDGFTLNDLVSYNEKHNDANGENNVDGETRNHSWNCGVEGPTDDPDVLALRARQRRNFLTTLLLSQGLPMLTAGDELGHTQQGNNHPYCQDNEVSWINWESADEVLLGFTRELIAFRQWHRVFRRQRFFTGRPSARTGGFPIPDIAWFAPDGRQMTEDDWDNPANRTLLLFVNGESITERGTQGERHLDDSFLLLVNAHDEPVQFVIPPAEYGDAWELVIATAADFLREGVSYGAGGAITVPDRSLIVLDRTV